MKPKARRVAQVRGLVDHVAHDVAGLQAEPLRKLLPALAHAERELVKDLKDALGALGGEKRYKAQMLRRALVQVRGGLNAVERVRPEMLGALHAAGRRSGQMANKHIMEELAAFSTRFGGTLTPIPLLAASKVVDKSLLDRFASSTKRWSLKSRDDIRHQLAVGTLRGENVSEMTRRLTGRNIPGLSPEEGAPIVGEELMRRYTSTAHRIVRTEVVNAYNEHAQDQIKQAHEYDSRIMKRWDSTIDGRTCPDCAELNGVSVEPSGEFPGGIDAPPLHPYCRCAVLVWREDWDGKASNEDVATVTLADTPDPGEIETE